MLKYSGLLLLFNLAVVITSAQNAGIKGIVTDSNERIPVTGATVSIYLQKDSAKKYILTTLTNVSGGFELTGIATGSYFFEISSIGYQNLKRPVMLNDSIKDMGLLSFTKQGKDLADVTIISTAPPVIQKGDTTQFSASQYKVNPDATTEDLVKKMPGITVAKDGTVTAQGEQVKKITIDGKDFFGDDASAALKNLPSEVVDKIQVFDKLSDQAQLTGFDDGNSVKAMNITTKSGIKNSQFGRAYAGYGTHDRYAAGGNISFFNGNRRISLVGNFNNINQQNFGSQDLLGVSSNTGANSGGGGRGGGANTDNFTIGQASGISKTNAFGINYSNQLGKKLTITGSYFFNNSHNTNESVVNTETFSTPKNLFSIQKSNKLTNNTNHRINLRLEYKIDSSNSIFIIPSINFQNNNSTTLAALQNFYGANDSVNTSLNRNTLDRQGYNIRNNVMYRHSFAKRGRTISVGLNTTFTKNDGTSITDAEYRFFKNGFVTDSLQQQLYDNTTNGHTIGGSIAYTEPVGKKAQIQIDYNPSIQKNQANQEAFSYDGQKYSMFDSTLSNKFNNTVTTNNAGINYRYSKSKDEQLSFGANIQNAKLESQRIFPVASSVNQSFFSLLPNAQWRKKFSTNSNIRLFYRASTNFPSVNQLQDVVNLTNPLRVSSGNPELKQSYTNLVSARYSYTNSKTSKSFFANLFLQTAADYISTAIYIAQNDSIIQQGIVLKKGSQLTKPVNLVGYKSLRTFFTYSMPVKSLKTVINLNAGFTYAKLPGLVNYTTTITNNYTYNAGVVLASNISEYIDFNVSYTANFNNATTISTTSSSNKYVNQTAGVQLNLLDRKGWFIKNDLTGQSYTGLSAGLNQSFWLWNAAIGKKILKYQAGEIKLSVFDLLKQNQSIVRTVTGAYIEDVQSQVLQQYFMLTFTYNLKNFGIAAKPVNNNFKGREGINGPGMDGRNPSF